MEFIIIAPERSQRAAQFQQFLTGEGHGAARMAPGQRVPVAKQCWHGAVCFELPAQVRAIQESVRYLGIPLAVVAPAPAEVETQVHEAGAEVICDLAATDARIVQDLQARCQIRALAPDLQKQLVGPLVTAVAQTLSQMAGAEVVVQSAYQRDKPIAMGDVSVTLALSQSVEGLLVLSFSLSTAEGLARRILADAADPLDPALVADCMGEVANIIAGQAKALFHGTPHHFVFSTPTVTLGHQGIVFKEGMTSAVIAFDGEKGGFALQLCRA